MARKKTLREQIEEQYGEFADSVVALGVSELDSMLLRYTKYREEVKESKLHDEQLQKTAELKKELEAPYRDALKAIDLKSRYLLLLIGEKGGDTSGSLKK